MLIKLGELQAITADNISEGTALAGDDSAILERFKKFAGELKTIAPLAKDFLYFTAVMMHAAEASLINPDGSIKVLADGTPVSAKWENVGKGDGVKWVCSDTNIKPYKNSNGDIFPESELVEAHKKWVGKPLCLDHKSSSVDMMRGLILDTFYDRKLKRVIALCALDKKNYPELARNVETGLAACVSMGTGVTRAVCTEDGCHRVARVESDFCEHMRRKSGYGEINYGLNPIELSIVMNGADGKAKIKHIIAMDLKTAINNLSDYMDKKIEAKTVSTEELASIKNDLASLAGRLDKLAEAKEDSNAAYGQTASTREMKEIEEANVTQLSAPEAVPSYAKVEDIIDGIKAKLASLQNDFNNLVTINKNNSEELMTEKKAYYQGTEEPTPGRPQYQAEDQITVRNTGDKHMVGQMDTGPVDGMHPGYDSFGEGEEERKRRLQRLAEAEERKLRREAALEKAKENLAKKEAYFQGTEEPTPGKPKYPKDPGEKVRNDGDKHMVGQKPFPGVGDVDGLHPSPDSADQKDELKRKEMLARASLKARFIKAANSDGTPNLGDARWDIYAGKNLILSATVNELTNGRSEILYDSVATPEFGKGLLSKIRSEGFESTKARIKGAQAAPAPVPPAEPPVADPVAEPKDPMVDGGAGGNVGELAEQVRDAAEEAAKRADDLTEAVAALEGETVQLDKVPAAPEEAFNAAASADVETLQSMRKTLNRMLVEGCNEAVVELRAHAEELNLAKEIYENTLSSLSEAQRKKLDKMAGDALAHAKKTLAGSQDLMKAFVKYAQGTNDLLKRAANKAAVLTKTAQEDVGDAHTKIPSADPVQQGATTDVKPGDIQKDVSWDGANDWVNDPMKAMENKLKKDPMKPQADLNADPLNPELWPSQKAAASDGLVVELPPGSPVPPNAKAPTTASAHDLTTKEGRAAYRAELEKAAQSKLQYSDMLNKFHPGGGTTVDLEVKPQGDAAKVERLDETQKRMLEVAVSAKTKKQAEEIQKLVVAGALSVDDVDGLVAHGVDKDAVAYWKKFYGEAKDSESSSFAADLLKEHTKQKSAEEKEAFEVRVKRAYDLAYDMRDRGIISDNMIKSQAEDLMKLNDEGFEQTKRIVARSQIQKKAMPQVGLLTSDQLYLPAAQPTEEQVDLVTVLNARFANKRY